MTKILFFLKRAFQAAYFEVSMVKIGSQTIGGIYQSLSPIKTAESESHAASSMRYQNTDLYISFLFLNRIGSSIPQNDRLFDRSTGSGFQETTIFFVIRPK